MEKMKFSGRLDDLVIKLFEVDIVKFGNFRLKSGIMSPFYFDLRPIISFPKLLVELADTYIEKTKVLKFNCIAGIPFTGLPIATAISIRGNYPMVHCRAKQKDYGTQKSVEGIYKKGDKVLIIDDTITDGASKLDSINLYRENNFEVHDVLIFLDREQEGKETLTNHSLNLVSVCGIFQLLDILLNNKKISSDMYRETVEFFKECRVDKWVR